MHRRFRAPLLASLYAVGLFATGLITWVGLVSWGWPIFNAAATALTVIIAVLWLTLWAGQVTAARRRHVNKHKSE